MARGPLTWRNVGESTGAGPGFAAGSAALLKSARESAVLGAKAFTDLGELREKAKTGELLAELQALENPETFAADAAALYARYKPGNINQELYTEKHDARQTLMDTLQTNAMTREKTEQEAALLEKELGFADEVHRDAMETGKSERATDAAERSWYRGKMALANQEAKLAEDERKFSILSKKFEEEYQNRMQSGVGIAGWEIPSTGNPEWDQRLRNKFSDFEQAESAELWKNQMKEYASTATPEEFEAAIHEPIIGAGGKLYYPSAVQKASAMGTRDKIAASLAGEKEKLVKDKAKDELRIFADEYTLGRGSEDVPESEMEILILKQAKELGLPIDTEEARALAKETVSTNRGRIAFEQKQNEIARTEWQNLVRLGITDQAGDIIGFDEDDQDDTIATIQLIKGNELDKLEALQRAMNPEQNSKLHFEPGKFDENVFKAILKQVEKRNSMTDSSKAGRARFETQY